MRIFLKRLGEAGMALGALSVSVVFWLCIAMVVLVVTVCIRIFHLIRPEQRRRVMLCEHGNIAPCVECDIEPLQAECDQLRKDAERYRWLLQECYRWPPHGVCSKEDQTEPVAIWTKFEGDDVDAAIDAAILKGREVSDG